jgi:arylsulfatase
VPWANVSNTPFRLYKHWVHEGGIATPLIVHWPDRLAGSGEFRNKPGQLPDIMATFIEVAEAEYPTERDGNEIFPLEGKSLTPIFDDEPNEREVLYWEHEGNRAVRKGKWKLVNKYPGDWELYDIIADRTELNDLAAQHPEVVNDLVPLYEEWAERCGVVPWNELMEEQRKKRDGEK